MTGRNEFSVWWWDPEGNYNREADHVDAETAVNTVRSLLNRKPAMMLGVFKRIIITDGGDFTVYEWKHGEGQTYPERIRE